MPMHLGYLSSHKYKYSTFFSLISETITSPQVSLYLCIVI